MRLHQLLNEMIVRYRRKRGADLWVIAHRENIWVVDSQGDEPEEVLTDIRERTGLTGETAEQMIEDAREERPDILIGNLYMGTLRIDNWVSIAQHPTASPLVAKVIRQLGLKAVVSRTPTPDRDDEDIRYAAKKVTGELPEVFYHGTNMKYLLPILRKGLMPTANHNWAAMGVTNFRDKIFLTASFTDAREHAAGQARRLDSVPLVIATRIPDPSKITMDYDVANTFYGHAYGDADKQGYSRSRNYGTNPNTAEIQKYNAGTDFTRQIGIIAYQGRIPASFFQKFWVWPAYETDPTAKPKAFTSAAALFRAWDRGAFDRWDD